jgi:hypothetical protein
MSLYRQLVNLPGVPWRLKVGFIAMVEGPLRRGVPPLYRFLHLGSLRENLRAVTGPPGHHFFGYYDKSPWNASQTLMLAHEAAFNDRAPRSDDSLKVGIVHPDERRFVPLGESFAWNWQQGAMLAWHPADPERLFVNNDRRKGRLTSVVRDVDGREIVRYDRPIYALSPNGRLGWSLNFARLAEHRPGYGYAGVADPWSDQPHPAEDGIELIDLASGEHRLVVSLDEVAANLPGAESDTRHHWFNHLQPSPAGTRVAFFHLWREGAQGWGARLYTMDAEGSNLNCALDTHRISHYDWLDEDHILVWARRPSGGEGFLLVDVRNGHWKPYASDVLTEDGHDSFSPDRRWVLNDTYPDANDMRTLMLVSWPTGRRIDIARLYSPKSRWWGEIRCDLHPRWSRDGTRVCIDSVHEGSRQMYELDVQGWTN